ncbi:MAG: restriction endonuclease, partial [Deltaproteobacteria bacterium]
MIDLKNDDDLKQAVEEMLANSPRTTWISKLTSFLEHVANADLEERSSRAFHDLIWEKNPVSDVGMGTVNVSSALDDTAFRQWIAEESLKALPNDKMELENHLQSFFDELVTRVLVFSKRKPLVKILRIMAGFFPRHFTSIAANAKAIECHRALLGKSSKKGPVKYQLELTERLNEVLGEAGNSPVELATRMTVAWELLDRYVVDKSEAPSVDTVPGDSQLKPLPALQRRKGLTAISGGMATLIGAIAFVSDGVSKEELMTHLRAEFPDYRESSLGTLFNVLKNEFRVIEQEGDLISASNLGTSILDTGEPEDLMPVMLTRILGFDGALKYIQKAGGCSVSKLCEFLKTVNPGWTSNFAPTSLIRWLREFGLVEPVEKGVLQLTERGQQWVEQVYWEPESLPPLVKVEIPESTFTAQGGGFDIGDLALEKLLGLLGKDMSINSVTVQQLHFGLWANERRHFAIMAGLSGSGKTLLARRYAQVVSEYFDGSMEENVFVQAVQPGWYDPTPIFGYINPLASAAYVRPALLDFVLDAAARPDEPFFIILDEMNLSHPEHYFAPVLSAMETGESLRLHNEGDSFDGVPCKIPYPNNLAFIGTVNMDETTHGLSDKVLDRAFTIEFWDIQLDSYPGWGQRSLPAESEQSVKQCLEGLIDALSPVRMHFGWRTVDEVLDYVDIASEASPKFVLSNTLDQVVYSKVLPK